MLYALQTAKAQKYHEDKRVNNKTCIDRHTGITHPENSEGLSTGID